MKIKLVSGIAMVLATSAALSGCSGGDDKAPGKDGAVSGTLTGVFDVTFKSTINKIVANFEKKYPNVKVKMNYQGGDVGGLISTQLQAGTAPDLLLTFPGGNPGGGAVVQVVTLASQNRLLDLSGSAWTKQVPDVWKKDVVYKGKTYGYPGAIQPLSAVYNKDKLDELRLKVPETLDEVYKLCADAKAAGVYAYSQGLGDAVAGGPQMMSYGQMASLLYGPNPDFPQQIKDGKATYQDSPWVEQFKIYKKMYDEDCFGKGSLGRSRQQATEAVAGGKALGTVDVGASKAVMEGVNKKATFVIAPIPATNDGKTYITALAGYDLAVNAKAKNPTAAKAFMDFLAEPEQSAIYASGFASVPIIPNDQFTPPAGLKDFAALVTAGKYAKLADLGAAEVQPALNEALQSMFLGKSSPEDVAKKMQKAFDDAK